LAPSARRVRIHSCRGLARAWPALAPESVARGRPWSWPARRPRPHPPVTTGDGETLRSLSAGGSGGSYTSQSKHHNVATAALGRSLPLPFLRQNIVQNGVIEHEKMAVFGDLVWR